MSEADADHPKNALLDDLESIRTLLNEPANAPANASAAAGANGQQRESTAAAADSPTSAEAESSVEPGLEEQVPLLDDVVDGALIIDERPYEQADLSARSSMLDDELFQALLGDSWKTSAAAILADTRAEIEEHRTTWGPEDTDELNNALRVRIDDTLKFWLRDAIKRNIDELRIVLLNAAEDELKQRVAELIHSKHDDDQKDQQEDQQKDQQKDAGIPGDDRNTEAESF